MFTPENVVIVIEQMIGFAKRKLNGHICCHNGCGTRELSK